MTFVVSTIANLSLYRSTMEFVPVQPNLTAANGTLDPSAAVALTTLAHEEYPMYLEFVADLCQAITLLLIGLYEGGAAATHAVSAAIRHQDARYLLTQTARRVEGQRILG